MAQSYEKAGVNLEAGYEVVRRIKKHVASTSRLGVMGNIGAVMDGDINGFINEYLKAASLGQLNLK